MIRPLDRINWGGLKLFVFGIMVGAVFASLYLDNRLGALIKAFENPQIVNSVTFEKVISSKK